MAGIFSITHRLASWLFSINSDVLGAFLISALGYFLIVEFLYSPSEFFLVLGTLLFLYGLYLLDKSGWDGGEGKAEDYL